MRTGHRRYDAASIKSRIEPYEFYLKRAVS